MKKIFAGIALSFIAFQSVHAQFEAFRDSVVQVYGVVMSADSLRALPAASISVIGRNQGTITNDDGVFSIVVLKGDKLEFSSVGFKPVIVTIPKNLEGNQHSIIQTLVQDTVYLPTTIITKYPTREEFEREFASTKIPDDQEELARQNMADANRRALSENFPMSGKEATQYFMKQNRQKYYSAGQLPPQNIFNPFAWREFIKAWKRGDFKRK